MAERLKKKNESYARIYDLATSGASDVKTENMYVDHTESVPCLESFPGYRRLTRLDGKINGIFTPSFGEEIYLVHAGAALYKCKFADSHRDEMTAERLCDMNDAKSSCYRIGKTLCILDRADITVIDEKLRVKKLSENADLAYIPTTYINGEEAEQVNMLSDKFMEVHKSISVSEMAYESEGLIYQIKSESGSTCVVTGVSTSFIGRVEIPTKKRINGKYYKVVEIGNNAFKSNDKITGVVIPGTVKRVGENAFAHCTSLSFAAMLDGIEIIDASAFYGCSSMTQVYIGITCKQIFFNAFYECPWLNKVYFSGDSSLIVNCEGFGEMLQYNVYYHQPYTDLAIGIPIYTPIAKVTKLTVDGVATAFNSFVDRGIIRLPYVNPGSLEGKTICVSGNINRTVIHSSKRATSFPLISDLRGYDAICSSDSATMFDGRALIWGSEGAGAMIFMSSFTLEGRAHPLYFGELDYMEVGNPAFPISCACGIEKHLVVAKSTEGSGSIFVHSPRGDQFSVYGRCYPTAYSFDKTDIRSGFGVFDDGLIFMRGDGACKLTCSTSDAKITPVSSGITELCDQGCADTIFSTLVGNLAVFTKGNLFLADPRLSYKIYGGENYRWFPIYNVGGYENEDIVYRYANTAPSGLYIHPDEGAAVMGDVYSYRDENGKMVYYVKIGLRNYAVVPSEEAHGGNLLSVSALVHGENTLIFGSLSGDILALNTDKRGCPPPTIYTKEGFDSVEYEKIFGKVIHPDFYTHARHAVRYSVTTPMDNGNAPYLTKSTVKKSLTIRLSNRSRESVSVSTSIDGGQMVELCSIPMGEIDFEDFDFGTLTMICEDFESLSIPENQRKWVEKQIRVYTEQFKSPFAINSISYGFFTDGRIKNK